MKYFVISTFSTEGRKNIGDKLIEECTIRLLRDVKGDCEIKTLYREEDIEQYLDEINNSKALLFACLAIRRNMIPRLYRFPPSLDRFKVPLVPLASGTSFRPNELFSDQTAARIAYDSETMNFLRSISKKAPSFSCRGEVTYNFLRMAGIENAVMTGDVAFYNPRFDDLEFVRKNGVSRIAVSTPHQPKIFAEHFYRLVSTLRATFMGAEIVILVHGASDWIEKKRLDPIGVQIRSIYEEPTSALDAYGEVDLHVGYRVHGHVSALVRRVPSYLLATDGRGYDYGMTLRTGSTWPAWKMVLDQAKPVKRTGFFDGYSRLKRSGHEEKEQARLLTQEDFDLVNYVVNIIKRDELTGFDRFLGFENEIRRFNRNLISFISEIP